MNGVIALIFLFAFSSADDRDKFEYIYSKYKKLLLYKANEILRDYALAEDAVSEAYIRIYKNLDKIEDPTSNRSVAFIVTITRNAALSMLEKEKKSVADDFDGEDEKAADFDLEQDVLSRLSSEHIFSIINGISEDLRNIFLLKYAYDMSHREIADSLGLTENNVTVRLHRAKKKLSEIMAGEGYVRG